MKQKIVNLILLISFLSLNTRANTYDWTLIYYMPYDNNLSALSKNIINQFLTTKLNGNVCVTLQVDLAGSGGMRRYIMNSKTDSIQIDEEKSASAKTLTEYLMWAGRNFKARHYAIILLNHGGSLNEYGLDEFPTSEWMQIDSVSNSMKRFNAAMGISKIDLLFEQVCTRGTIENLFQFRDVAKFTLASQDLVPAPGYYYSTVFSLLETGRTKSGDQLADLIVKSERDDMFYGYTLIDNSKWKDWLELLDNYVVELDNRDFGIAIDSLKYLFYGGQTYCDFVSLLDAASDKKISNQSSAQLKTYTKDGLIRRYYRNQKSNCPNNYSGLSICSPFKILNAPLDIYSVKSFKKYLLILNKFRSKRSGR